MNRKSAQYDAVIRRRHILRRTPFLDKFIHPVISLFSDLCRKSIESMCPAGKNSQFRLVAGRQPPDVHEKGIVQERIQGADSEERVRHIG